MLIAPLIKAKGDAKSLTLPSPHHRLTPTQAIPEWVQDATLRLAEGHTVQYLRIHPDDTIELVETFTLDKFTVENGTALWRIMSGSGQIAEGSFQAVSLAQRLSVKLVTPILLMPSKTGLKTTFQFRLDPGFRVMTRGKFKSLIGMGE